MSKPDYYVPSPDELEKWWHDFVDSLFDERPLACALIATAYVDAALAALLLKHFVKSKTTAPRLLDSEHGGPLGSFRIRTDVAYCLGLISGRMQTNLYKIGEIRNIFAHGFDRSIDFTLEKIAVKCGELHIPPMNLIFAKDRTQLWSFSSKPLVDEKGEFVAGFVAGDMAIVEDGVPARKVGHGDDPRSRFIHAAAWCALDLLAKGATEQHRSKCVDQFGTS